MKFFCENCKKEFQHSTKYHVCASCGGKLYYDCPKCSVRYGANYQAHIRKCQKVPEEAEKKIIIFSYKFGKHKIIAVTNYGEITVAYICDKTKKILFGRERQKK